MALFLMPIFLFQISLEELLNKAMKNNPEILSAQRIYRATLYQKEYYRWWLPNPEIGFGASFSEPRFEFSISQKLPFPSKLNALGKKADSVSSLELKRLELMKWEIKTQIKEHYFELWFIYSQKEILEDMKMLVSDLAEVVQSRYRFGQEPIASLIRVQIELSKIQERIINLSADISVLSSKISELVGEIPDSNIFPEGDIFPAKFDLPYSQLKDIALAHSPQLQVLQAEIELNKSDLFASKTELYPDFGFMFDTMGGMMRAMITFEIPAFFRKKEVKKIMESQEILLSSHSRFEAEKNRVLNLLKSFKDLSDSSFELWKLYKEVIIPQAELNFSAARANWEVGKVDFLTVIDSLTLLLSYKIEEKRYVSLNRKYNANIEKLLGLDEKEVINYEFNKER